MAVDVGSWFHQVAVGDAAGRLLDEFRIDHGRPGSPPSSSEPSVTGLPRNRRSGVAMEGYNGWARPLDRQTLERGWALYNVNNLKLARYKEIFPSPAKSDRIDTRSMLELFFLDAQRGVARNVLQRVAVAPQNHRRLKYLTRRRRVLVKERARRPTRLGGDLQALSPGLLAITGTVDNQ